MLDTKDPAATIVVGVDGSPRSEDVGYDGSAEARIALGAAVDAAAAAAAR